MKIERDHIHEFETAVLFQISENSKDYYLQRAWAMEELAKRALNDKSLLGRLLPTLGKNIAVEGRNGAPLGFMATAILVDSHDNEILREIALSASSWSVWNQNDFFNRYFENHERKENFDKMVSFGMRPKVSVNVDGEVRPEP